MMIGERNHWKLGGRVYDADDHPVGQFYLTFAEEFSNPAMMKHTHETFDKVVQDPKTGSLLWVGKGHKDHREVRTRWSWCDALFMAPPVWVRLAKVTGDQKYLDFMDQEYHVTYDLLWDKDAQLFWRDSSFLGKKEANGEKIFWSRGNGWVYGGGWLS